jgi:hypothetical protein
MHTMRMVYRSQDMTNVFFANQANGQHRRV